MVLEQCSWFCAAGCSTNREGGYKVDEHGKDDAAEDVEVDKERDNHNHDYWESVS